MTKDDFIDTVAIGETQVILESITSLASHGDKMCFYAGGDMESDAMFHQLLFMRDLVNRMGWLADLGLGKLGRGQCVGGAEEWLLPPSYKWPREEATEAEQKAA